MPLRRNVKLNADRGWCCDTGLPRASAGDHWAMTDDAGGFHGELSGGSDKR
jgi:hypothetical protein